MPSAPLAVSKKFAAYLFSFLIIKSLLFVFLVPPWLGNDEANHFEYVLVLAGEGEGTSNQKRIIESLNETGYWAKTEMKPPPGGAEKFRDTDLHNHGEEVVGKRPFLYYWLASLPIKYFETEKLTSKLAMARLVSAAFSMLAVWFVYLSAKTVFEGPRQFAASSTAALLAGLHPQFSYISASVNADLLAIALFSFVFYWFVRRIKAGGAKPLSIAFLLVLIIVAMLTKKHAVGLLPISILGLALLVPANMSGWLRKVSAVYLWFFGFCLAGLILAEYFFPTDVIKVADRVFLSLGFFSPSAEDIAGISLGGYARAFAIMFVTYWFTYGQMVYKLSFGFYALYGLFTVLFLAGFTKKVVGCLRGRDLTSPASRYIAFSIMFVAVILLMNAVTFFTPQFIDRVSGRYLFYAIAPITIITLYGLREASRLLKTFDFEIIAVYFFIAMNLVALFGYLLPIYHV